MRKLTQTYRPCWTHTLKEAIEKANSTWTVVPYTTHECLVLDVLTGQYSRTPVAVVHDTPENALAALRKQISVTQQAQLDFVTEVDHLQSTVSGMGYGSGACETLVQIRPRVWTIIDPKDLLAFKCDLTGKYAIEWAVRHWPVLQFPKIGKKTCECGSKQPKGPMHSSWCPIFIP